MVRDRRGDGGRRGNDPRAELPLRLSEPARYAAVLCARNNNRSIPSHGNPRRGKRVAALWQFASNKPRHNDPVGCKFNLHSRVRTYK